MPHEFCLADLGYIPSYLPKNPKPKPKLLEDEESWEYLKKDVLQHIEQQAASKARGKGSKMVKPFHITIIDMSAADDLKSSKKGKAESSNNDGERDVLKGSFPQEEHDLYKAIEKQHKCEKHDRACYVQDDGSHYQYTVQDLSTWAFLASRHKATLDTPPIDALKLTDKAKVGRQSAAKATIDVASKDPDPPSWLGAFAAIMAATQRQAPMLLGPAQEPPPASLSSQHKRSASVALAINYPLLKNWLPALDNHPVYGRHQEDFASLLPRFEKEKIFDLGDLMELSHDTLQQITGAIGTANRLRRFGETELEELGISKHLRTH